MASGLFKIIRKKQAAVWAFIVGMGLTFALGWELDRQGTELDRQRLARRVVEIQAQLDARLEKSEMLLHNLRDYLMWSGVTDEKGFQRWCYDNGHTINCRWLAGIALATNRNIIQWPDSVPKTPKTWGTNEWRALNEVTKVQSIECDLALKSALTNTMNFVEDYDLRSLRGDRKRFTKTIRNSRLGMSEQQIVMRDLQGNGIPGTCFHVPIYEPKVAELVSEVMTSPFTNASYRSTLYWWYFSSVIVAPVDYNFLAWAITEDSPDDVRIELFSSTNQLSETWLNKSGPIPHAADPEFRPYLAQRQLWPMYGLKFSIFFYTTPLFEAQSPRRLAKVAAGAGCALTLMATTLVGLALRSRDQQEDLTNQIRDARDALSEAQKAREKFSRDLHDGTIQSLYAIQLGLGHLGEKLEKDPSRARRDFGTVCKELDAVIAEVRNFVNAGDSATHRAVNFNAVLNALVRRAQAGASARITLQCDNEAASQLSAADAIQLANIAREAISNCLRHAKPARIDVALNVRPNGIKLTVTDDGCGFDPDSPQQFGVGLKSMQTRAHEMNGTFVIESSPGRGTRIRISVPAEETAPA